METAMRSVESNYDFTVRWLPFQLRPNHPIDGVPKAPDTPDNPRVGHRLKQAGQAVGIDFTGKTDNSPNTVMAHQLLTYALDSKGAAVQDNLSEVLFRHYFTDGKYPNEANLLDAAKEVGLDEDGTKAALADTSLQQRVKKEAQQASQQGINGVPYFFINGNPAFSGAQNPSSFVSAFEELK